MQLFQILYRLPFQRIVFAFLVAIASIAFSGCNQRDHGSNKARGEMLDRIEEQMFQRPESLDSLLGRVDTTNMTPLEEARISMIKGYIHYRNREYDKSIIASEIAETIFSNHKDYYHKNINHLIKAFTFELLRLDDNAAKLYVESKNYFEKNHLDRFKFYASLGVLRLSNDLNMDKDDKDNLIKDLNKIVNQLNDPLYNGLLYSSMGNIEKNNSLKCEYYEKANNELIQAKRWSTVYTIELNTLYAKINQDPSEKTQQYYNEFPESDIPYTPTPYQRMRYDYAQAHLYGRQGKNEEALVIATQLLNESISLNFPSIQADCTNLLSVVYMRMKDYENAYHMLVEENSLRASENEIMQKNRLLALGADYRYSELEKDKLDLKVKNQKNLIIFSFFSLILTIGLSIFWFLWKDSKLKREILKIKNIEIEDQFSNLLYSLNNEKHKNARLIEQLENLKIQYQNRPEISLFQEAIIQNKITSQEEFEALFIQLKPGWIENIKKQQPDLTPTDLQYCMFFYFNCENSTIHKIFHKNEETIKSAKKRIRDKFALDNAKEIYVFLKKFD